MEPSYNEQRSLHSSPASTLTVAFSPLLDVRPAGVEVLYEQWRYARGLVATDLTYAIYTTTSAAITFLSWDAAASATKAAPGVGVPALSQQRWTLWLAALVALSLVQAALILSAPSTYRRARTPLLLVQRLINCVSSTLVLRQVAAPQLRAQLSSAPRDLPLVKSTLLTTDVLRLALQPFGQPLPFRLALVPQLLEAYIAAAAGAQLTAAAVEARPELGGALQAMYDWLDGGFHVATGLMLPAAHAGAGDTCSAVVPEVTVRFMQALLGAALPLYVAYHSEAAEKARFCSLLGAHGCWDGGDGGAAGSDSDNGGGGAGGGGDDHGGTDGGGGGAGVSGPSSGNGASGGAGGRDVRKRTGAASASSSNSASTSRDAGPVGSSTATPAAAAAGEPGGAARAPPATPPVGFRVELAGACTHQPQGPLECCCLHLARLVLLVLATWGLAAYAWWG